MTGGGTSVGSLYHVPKPSLPSQDAVFTTTIQEALFSACLVCAAFIARSSGCTYRRRTAGPRGTVRQHKQSQSELVLLPGRRHRSITSPAGLVSGWLAAKSRSIGVPGVHAVSTMRVVPQFGDLWQCQDYYSWTRPLRNHTIKKLEG